jgi:hypothetical protein
MVADAVAIEPVSASRFPANREKNREFFNLRATSEIRVAREPNDFGAFELNSLNKRTGNILEWNREFQPRNREFHLPKPT